jgi:hypothetical protein
MTTSHTPNEGVPQLVLDYFGQPTDQVQVVQLYSRRGGWVNVSPGPANWDTLLALYDHGVASKFGLRYDDRVADFDMDELMRYARRGWNSTWQAYADRQPVL